MFHHSNALHERDCLDETLSLSGNQAALQFVNTTSNFNCGWILHVPRRTYTHSCALALHRTSWGPSWDASIAQFLRYTIVHCKLILSAQFSFGIVADKHSIRVDSQTKPSVLLCGRASTSGDNMESVPGTPNYLELPSSNIALCTYIQQDQKTTCMYIAQWQRHGAE